MHCDLQHSLTWSTPYTPSVHWSCKLNEVQVHSRAQIIIVSDHLKDCLKRTNLEEHQGDVGRKAVQPAAWHEEVQAGPKVDRSHAARSLRVGYKVGHAGTTLHPHIQARFLEYPSQPGPIHPIDAVWISKDFTIYSLSLTGVCPVSPLQGRE